MSAWVSLGITLILIALVYIVLTRSIVRRTSREVSLDEIRREVGAILTELNATTERNIELIEDRMRALEQLIAQADRRLGALRRDLVSRESGDDAYSRLRPVTPTAAGATDRAAGDTPSVRGAAEDIAAPGGQMNQVPVRVRVRELYRQGLPLERIASLVGKTVGEVELMVSLEERSER